MSDSLEPVPVVPPVRVIIVANTDEGWTLALIAAVDLALAQFRS